MSIFITVLLASYLAILHSFEMEGIFYIAFFFHNFSNFLTELPFLLSTKTGDQCQKKSCSVTEW